MDRPRSSSLSGRRLRQSHPSLPYHPHVPASPSSSPISATIPSRSRRRSTRQTNPLHGSCSVVRRLVLRSEPAHGPTQELEPFRPASSPEPPLSPIPSARPGQPFLQPDLRDDPDAVAQAIDA